MERIGILGGTFDPPHIGHLILAEYATDSLELTRLLFVPAANPPHKQDELKTPISDRVKMLELALADNMQFSISRVDIDRPGPHYSVDTVSLIKRQYSGSEFYFVMGGDSLRDLPTWYRPDELIRLCKLAIMRRPGVDIRPDMHEDVLPGMKDRIIIFDAPLIEISSTEIAARLAQHRSIRYLVPDKVREYIEAYRLYGAVP
jgi:nicotinate-nucleotide adenylyltransferase